MRSPGKQKGMTAIGWLLVIVFGGIFVYAGIILVPVYLKGYSVATSLNSLTTDSEARGKSVGELQRLLIKRLDINLVDNNLVRQMQDDISITRSDNGGYSVEIDYEPRVKFIGNLYFVVVFDKTVNVPGS